MVAARRLFPAAFALALLLPIPSARAELAKWDQTKVTALAVQLSDAAKNLQDTFYKQPPATIGSGQSRDYQRLKQTLRRLRQEADQLKGDLDKGTGQEETLPQYEDLMMSVRDAREVARRLFTTQDMKDAASRARAVLNQLAPYYDPDAVPIQPLPSMR
jgi:hypothetical protein